MSVTVIVRGDEAEYLGSIGHRLLADAGATGGALSAHRVTLGPGARGAEPHRHDRSAELFFIVDGALEVLIDDEVVMGGAGDLLVVPPAVAHAFAACPDQPADVLVVLTPGVARFDYLRQVARQRAGLQEPEVLAAQQDRFDTYGLDSAVWRAARHRRPDGRPETTDDHA